MYWLHESIQVDSSSVEFRNSVNWTLVDMLYALLPQTYPFVTSVAAISPF